MRKMLVIQYSHKMKTTFRENIFMKQITAEYCSNLTNMFVMRCFKELVEIFLISNSIKFWSCFSDKIYQKYGKNSVRQTNTYLKYFEKHFE